MLHYKAVDLHEVSSARRGDLAEEAGVGVCKAGREEGIECGLASGA